MADSPLCDICGVTESVEHQLILCRNANRRWQLFNSLTGSTVTSLQEVLSCSHDNIIEILSLKGYYRLIEVRKFEIVLLQ